jgi:hypothetical protein
MVQIRVYEFNNVYIVVYFKNLNDVELCIRKMYEEC